MFASFRRNHSHWDNFHFWNLESNLVLGWCWVQYEDNGPNPVQIGPPGDSWGAFEIFCFFSWFFCCCSLLACVCNYSDLRISYQGYITVDYSKNPGLLWHECNISSFGAKVKHLFGSLDSALRPGPKSSPISKVSMHWMSLQLACN